MALPASPQEVAVKNDKLARLQSQRSGNQLQQIAGLRARGVADYINLPQVVVCGDQSAGKSSVLNSMSQISFPRGDGVCTKFATEIIIEHTGASEIAIAASIIPAADRDADTYKVLTAFKRNLDNFEELPAVIEEAGTLMGVRGYGDNDANAPGFTRDILRLNVTGSTRMHLTIVDLPGLISATSDAKYDGDKEIVHQLVDSYIENPRTIILAVVQASNDVANQPIIAKARQVDRNGERTLGIITKPDLINKGTEARIARLARNEDNFQLKLGFFLLKNPTPEQIANGISYEASQQDELSFFKEGNWKDVDVDMSRVGATALRLFVQNKLDQHIQEEIPKVRDELRTLIKSKELELEGMGDKRDMSASVRLFLTSLSMKFQDLVVAGLHGNYDGSSKSFFRMKSKQGLHIRLRAHVHQLNTTFSNDLRQSGMRRKVVETGPQGHAVSSSDEDDCHDDVSDDDDDEHVISPVSKSSRLPVEEVTPKKMLSWIRRVHLRTRGRELPGDVNYVLLSELFHQQSSRWLYLTQDHVTKVYKDVTQFMCAVLKHVLPEDASYSSFIEMVDRPLDENLAAAQAELEKLWADEAQQPITYNHYYTDNVQHARQESAREGVKKALKDTSVEEYHGRFHISNNAVDADNLSRHIQKRVIVDMDQQTCTAALASLNAYYKVARKTWVDNVCRQVIERHLLRGLLTIFNANIIAIMSDDELLRLAGETPARRERREQLSTLLRNLRQGLAELSG